MTKMQNIDSQRFWDAIGVAETGPLDLETVIEIDIQEETTFSRVLIGTRVVGEEVSCHRTGRSRCYLSA